MATMTATKIDSKLIPPQVLTRMLEDLEHNREFDMGGYSVPTTKFFDQLSVHQDARSK